MTQQLDIDFVSDVACPWCAVGLYSLEEALRRLGDAVSVRWTGPGVSQRTVVALHDGDPAGATAVLVIATSVPFVMVGRRLWAAADLVGGVFAASAATSSDQTLRLPGSVAATLPSDPASLGSAATASLTRA